MPTVKIKSLVQDTLSPEEYSWMLRHLHEPLPVMSLTYSFYTGKVWHIAIFAYDSETDNLTCITLFVDSNQLQYVLENLWP